MSNYKEYLKNKLLEDFRPWAGSMNWDKIKRQKIEKRKIERIKFHEKEMAKFSQDSKQYKKHKEAKEYWIKSRNREWDDEN